MARTRSITSIDSEIQKIEGELINLHRKQEDLESKLSKLEKAKQEIETKQVMDAFKKVAKACANL